LRGGHDGIDAHHHVWDLAVRDQPWITGEVMSPIRRTFTLDEQAQRGVLESLGHGSESVRIKGAGHFLMD
jgi:predicted TIM-barrel fold metal-dependent hydrolase